MNLEITKEKSETLSALEDIAIQTVGRAIRGNGELSDADKAAIKVLAVVAKNRQTGTARAALGFKMAKTLMSPEELKTYVAATMPVSQKQMPAKQKVKKLRKR